MKTATRSRLIKFFSIFLCLLMLISSVGSKGVSVFAEEGDGTVVDEDTGGGGGDAGVNEKVGSFIRYFSEARSSLVDPAQISKSEMYVFSAFLSNFYVPLTTRIGGDVTENLETLTQKVGNIFNKTTPEDLAALKGSILKSWQAPQYPLTITATKGKLPDIKLEASNATTKVATVRLLLDCYAYATKKPKDFSFELTYSDPALGGKHILDKVSNGNSEIKLQTLLFSALLSCPDLATIKGTISPIDASTVEASVRLSMDTYGNIVIGTRGTILLPSCMNPKTFVTGRASSASADTSGYMFPLNNAFMMGSILNPSAFRTVSGGNSFEDSDLDVPMDELLQAHIKGGKVGIASAYTAGTGDKASTLGDIYNFLDKPDLNASSNIYMAVNRKKVSEALGEKDANAWYDICNFFYSWGGGTTAVTKNKMLVTNTNMTAPLSRTFADVGCIGGSVADFTSAWGSNESRQTIKIQNLFFNSAGKNPDGSWTDVSFNNGGTKDSALAVLLRETVANAGKDSASVDAKKTIDGAKTAYKAFETARKSSSTLKKEDFLLYLFYNSDYLTMDYLTQENEANYNAGVKALSKEIQGEDALGSFKKITSIPILTSIYNAVTGSTMALEDVADYLGSNVIYTKSLSADSPTTYAKYSEMGKVTELNINMDNVEHNGAINGAVDGLLNRTARMLYSLLGVNEAVYSILKQNYQADGAFMNVTGNNLWAGIYWAYANQLFKGGITFDKDGNMITGDYDGTLPDIPGGLGDLSVGGVNSWGAFSDGKADYEVTVKNSVINISKLLATDFNDYKVSWLKSNTDAIFLTAHYAMIGSSFANSKAFNVGTSKYGGMTSHLVTPRLNEIPYTSAIVANFGTIYVVLMVCVLVLLIFMWITKRKTLKEAIVTLLMLSFAFILPNTLTDAAVVTSNKVTEKIYSDRFNFWAITQHQQYKDDVIKTGGDSSSIDDIWAQNVENAKNSFNTQEVQKTSGVRLKWMSPKKVSQFDAMFGNNGYENKGGATNLTMFKWLMSDFLYNESYSNDPLSTYMYRPYNELATFAESSVDEFKDIGGDLGAIGGIDLSLDGSMYPDMDNLSKGIKQKAETNLQSVMDGYYAGGTNFGSSDMTRPDLIDDTHFSPMMNDEIFSAITQDINPAGMGNVGMDLGMADGSGVSDAYKQYLLYSESVYYYFYNVLSRSEPADALKEADATTGDIPTVNLLMSEDLFMYKDTVDEVEYKRDFLDMESLFTYVIPVLKQGNAYVNTWTDHFGTTIPPNSVGATADAGSAEQAKADALRNVWTMYAPWVDSMSTSKSLNQKAGVQGKSIVIGDSLLPSEYYSPSRPNDPYERPMVFSEADMVNKGLEFDDLTDTESRIQRVLDKTKKDAQYLINYAGFDSDVLMSALAMSATFNFNKEFSTTKLVGESVQIYPQGYELKMFNYDAFMRLILLNSTGEPAYSGTSVYESVLKNTSFMTGVLLLGVDVLDVYVIPTLKLFVLLALFILGILLCFSMFMEGLKPAWEKMRKGFITPLLLFLLLSIGHALVIGMIMGEGLIDVVGSKTAVVATNDPTITLLILLGVAIAYVIGLFLLLKKFWKTGFGLTAALGASAALLASGAVSKIAGGIRNSVSSVSSLGRNIKGSFREHNRYKWDKEAYKSDKASNADREASRKNDRGAGKDDAIRSSGASKYDNNPEMTATMNPDAHIGMEKSTGDLSFVKETMQNPTSGEKPAESVVKEEKKKRHDLGYEERPMVEQKTRPARPATSKPNTITHKSPKGKGDE